MDELDKLSHYDDFLAKKFTLLKPTSFMIDSPICDIIKINEKFNFEFILDKERSYVFIRSNIKSRDKNVTIKCTFIPHYFMFEKTDGVTELAISNEILELDEVITVFEEFEGKGDKALTGFKFEHKNMNVIVYIFEKDDEYILESLGYVALGLSSNIIRSIAFKI